MSVDEAYRIVGEGLPYRLGAFYGAFDHLSLGAGLIFANGRQPVPASVIVAHRSELNTQTCQDYPKLGLQASPRTLRRDPRATSAAPDRHEVQRIAINDRMASKLGCRTQSGLRLGAARSTG